MKWMTAILVTLVTLSLAAGSNDHSAAADHHNSNPSRKEQGDHHDLNNGHDKGHDHGKSKPPHPPKPPKHQKGVPAAPTGLVADAVSLFQVNLTWSDNSTNELGFKIERAFDGTNFVQIAQVLPDTTEYRDLNRFPDTKYFYRVRAFSAKEESAYSNVARTQTPAPECRLSLIASSGIGYGIPALDKYELVAIAPGASHQLVLKADRTVLDLANGAVNSVSNLADVIAIASGEIHGLALKSNGTVVGWAEDNYYGQATPPPNLTNVTAIAAGGVHSLALKNDGTVVAWGDDTWWQARPPINLTGVVAIAGGLYHNLALRSDGTVVGWGFNDQNAAQPPSGLRDVIAIAAGSSHSLALKRDGTVVGWGTSAAAIIPTNLTGVVAIAAGDNYSAALKNDGTIAWWSGNNYGGFPSPGASIDPGFTGVVALKIGSQYSMMLTTLPSSPSTLSIELHADNLVHLQWDDASVDETGYLVERDLIETSGDYVENWEHLATVDAGITNFVDESTIAGASYYYVVRPQSACGTSPVGTWGTVTVSGPTNAPYFTSVTARGEDALLSFAIQSWSGASLGIIEYRLERAEDIDGQPGEWREIAVVEPSSSPYFYSQETSYTDVNLSVDSTNWYRVRAVNGLGISPYSQPRSVSIVQPVTPQLSYTINDTDHVRLSWSGFGWSDLVGFRIERTTNILNSLEPWEEIAVIPPANPPQGESADTTALPGLIYWYRIRAFNDAGISGYSQPTRVDLLSPPQLSVAASAVSNSVLLATYASFPPPDGGVHINFDYITGQALRFERAEDVNGAPGSWKSIVPQRLLSAYYYADFGLAPDHTYWYRAKISTWLGDSPFSTPVSVRIVPPQPPQEVRAQIGATNHITLRWRPAYRYDIWPMNLQEQFGYKIERAIESPTETRPWVEIASVGLTNSRYYNFEDTVSGIGLTYRYRVRSFNSAGQSTYVDSFPVALNPPPQPSLGASVYINQVWLGFNVSVLGVTGFRLERAPDLGGNPGDWSNVATFPPQESAGNNYTDIIPAIESGYWYRVQAYNWIGDSEFSAPLQVGIRPPRAPESLRALIGSTNQVQLYWYFSGEDEAGYLVERASITNGEIGEWRELTRWTGTNLWSGPSQGYLDTSAQPLAEYGYRIRAYNEIGISAPSEILPFTVAPPPAPTALQASFYRDRVTLSWDTSSSIYDYGEMEGYEIERAIDSNGAPGSWARIARVATYPMSYTDLNPVPSSTSWYRVRAINWVGASDYTLPTAIAVVPPAVPRRPSATVGRSNQVNLSWYAGGFGEQDGFLIDLAEDIGNQSAAWQQLDQVAATNQYAIQYTHSNVVAWTTNWYRIRAFAAGGISAPSESLEFVVKPPPPPTSLSGEQLADHVTLRWWCTTDDYIEDFTLERAQDDEGLPGSWQQIAHTPATNDYNGHWYSNTIDSGLSANSTYWYRVRANNWVGESDPSGAIAITVQPPAAPRTLSGTIGEAQCVSIRWWPGTADATGYYLERAVDGPSENGQWTQIATAQSPDFLFGYLDTNLMWFATNRYRVRAFNALGLSPYSPVLNIAIVPPPPPQFHPVAQFANQAQLSWLSPASTYGFVAGFKVERASDMAGGPGAWTEVFDDTQSSAYWGQRTFTDINLTPHAKYWYRVASYNWLGQGAFSEPQSVTIAVPKAPNNLWVSLTWSNMLDLCWTAAPPYDQDGFAVERSSDSLASWQEIAHVSASNLASSSYLDAHPVLGVTNYYRVRAFNIVGDSPYSDIAAATIVLPDSSSSSALDDASQPRITQLLQTNHDVLLTWTAPGGTTNVVEATANLREAFAPISPKFVLSTDGDTTNHFLDFGALTNSVSRFYRIRVVK